MIQSLSKMPFSFTNNLFCCTTPNHVALVGEKKTSEARGERGEEQKMMRPASPLPIAHSRQRGGSVGDALRKPERKRKETFTEPSLFTFGRRGDVGPMGLRGFSLTVRTKKKRKLVHLAVEREEMAATKFVSNGASSAESHPRRDASRLAT